MRSRIHTVTICLGLTILGASTPVEAQDRGQFGLGVGINSSLISELTNQLAPTIYMPIMAGDELMVEPGIGLVRVSGGNSTQTLLALQAGLLFMVHGGEDDRVYVGPRVGLLRQSQSIDELDLEDSETNFTFAGVVGGEFFLRELFSLGGEVGLRYLDVDNGSLLTSSAEFRVRWYFSQ